MAFLISVLSGLLATALFELVRSKRLRTRLAALLRQPLPRLEAVEKQSLSWLATRLVFVMVFAFLGSGLLAAIAEQLGHPEIILTSLEGGLLAAIAGLGAWVGSRTLRLFLRSIASVVGAVGLSIFVLAPLLAATIGPTAPVVPIACLFLLFLALWQLLGWIPALQSRSSNS